METVKTSRELHAYGDPRCPPSLLACFCNTPHPHSRGTCSQRSWPAGRRSAAGGHNTHARSFKLILLTAPQRHKCVPRAEAACCDASRAAVDGMSAARVAALPPRSLPCGRGSVAGCRRHMLSPLACAGMRGPRLLLKRDAQCRHRLNWLLPSPSAERRQPASSQARCAVAEPQPCALLHFPRRVQASTVLLASPLASTRFLTRSAEAMGACTSTAAARAAAAKPAAALRSAAAATTTARWLRRCWVCARASSLALRQ